MLTRLSDAPDIRPDDILIIGCLRNEALRLPWFLRYHRQLGVTRFLLVDNGSSDGSRAFLQAQSDVTLFHTDQSYSASQCGIDWQNTLLTTYASGHWTLILDIDEFFIFPGYERTALRDLLTYLEQIETDAMVAPMLDMYADRPFAETGYVAGENLLDCCPYFDTQGYTLGKAGTPSAGLPVRGGPRQRLFWASQDMDYPAPFLQKFPLVRWRDDLYLTASTHKIDGVRVAPVTGLLLHFKMLQDFAETAREETERQEHFAEARQYQAYDRALHHRPDTKAIYEYSERFQSSARMQKLGLMKTPKEYPF
ncbi:glycosyltransferase family 2 protein [Cognatishimia maritima]|uniref:Glycosyl transferase family 2 n=1 Tax=Cognatishimia maritima TaxID=870908 RepID=A0A1M5WFE8_9RHOB|nr:glycosyltransferase family 2 protein [Cognatishimia maritima]SHH86221.1 Glycosyl transferase family 2 [Cognatishimia maritima]